MAVTHSIRTNSSTHPLQIIKYSRQFWWSSSSPYRSPSNLPTRKDLNNHDSRYTAHGRHVNLSSVYLNIGNNTATCCYRHFMIMLWKRKVKEPISRWWYYHANSPNDGSTKNNFRANHDNNQHTTPMSGLFAKKATQHVKPCYDRDSLAPQHIITL